MDFLLDTHIMLWFLNDDAKLALEIRDKIEACDQVFVSIISLQNYAQENFHRESVDDLMKELLKRQT